MIVFDSLVDCRVFLRFLVLPRYLIIANRLQTHQMLLLYFSPTVYITLMTNTANFSSLCNVRMCGLQYGE